MSLNLYANYFVDRSIVEGDCWVWQGAVINSGYGNMGVQGKTYTAHRASYLHYHGEIPEGCVVMHSCDNRLCVNPAHLTAGTQKNNINDCMQKGRFTAPGRVVGEVNPSSKLSDREVWQIKDLYKCGLFMNKEIAQWYGLKANTVVMIGNGTRRQKVPNPYLKE